MPEGFTLFAALLFMGIPVINMIVAPFVFGWPGFWAALVITLLTSK